MPTPAAYERASTGIPLSRTYSDPSLLTEDVVERVAVRSLLRSVWSVASVFFRAREARLKAWCMAGALLAMMIFFAMLHLWFLKLFRTFQNALHEKKQEEFNDAVYTIIVVAVGIMPVRALRDLLKGALALEWRRYITSRLLREYIGDAQAYYRLKFEENTIDNPDQRIAQDVGSFTAAVLQFSTHILQAIISIVTQAGILIAISRELFLFVLLYSFALNVLTFAIFGGPLTRLNRQTLAQEATLRFGLVRVREHAEPIAFYQGAPFEKEKCDGLFSSLLTTLYKKMALTVTFEVLLGAADLIATVMPYIVIANKFFSNEIDFGSMSTGASVLMSLQHAFSALVNQFDMITNMGAQALRIQQLTDVLHVMTSQHETRDVDSDDETDSGDFEKIPSHSYFRRAIELKEFGSESGTTSVLRLINISLHPPRGDVPLVHDLNLRLEAGQSLLVCGPSGIGKSSLLRAIGGLWANGSGTIERCSAGHSFFVPQEPYLCLGSLRENATYPGTALEDGQLCHDVSDADIRGCLDEVNIGYLNDRFELDDLIDWDSILSGGEKQRMGFVRLLLRKLMTPKLRFAIMDEATSALDEANENIVYALLKERVCSYVSVGHRKNLENFHTHKLLLERLPSGVCSWKVEQISVG